MQMQLTQRSCQIQGKLAVSGYQGHTLFATKKKNKKKNSVKLNKTHFHGGWRDRSLIVTSGMVVSLLR